MSTFVRNRFLSLGVSLSVGVALALLSGCEPEPIEQKGPPPRTVTANEVTTGTVPLYIDTLGRATAIEEVNIVSQVRGRIVEAPFTQGSMVEEGDLLFKIYQAPYIAAVEKAEGVLEQAKAQLAIDELALKRNEPLVPQKLISEQDFQALEATVEKDRGAVREAEGDLLAAQVNLDYTEIRSPVDGMASIYFVNVGNVVSEMGDQVLATVLTLDPIYVDFIAPEAKFDEIREYYEQAGGSLKVQATYLSDESKSRMGEVTILGNSVGTETGTVNLRATFDNEDQFFWPNQPMAIRVILEELEDAVLAPSKCVGIGQKGHYVFVINEEKGIVNLKHVEIGQEQPNDMVVIKSGVKPGDKLVGEGLTFLRDDMEVIVTDGNPKDVKLPEAMIQPIVERLKKSKRLSPEEIQQIEQSRRLPPKLLKKMREHNLLTEKEEDYIMNLETGSTSGEPQKTKQQSGSSEGSSK